MIYDHNVDQTQYKWGSDVKLTTIGLNEMPDYLRINYKKYTNWIDN